MLCHGEMGQDPMDRDQAQAEVVEWEDLDSDPVDIVYVQAVVNELHINGVCPAQA